MDAERQPADRVIPAPRPAGADPRINSVVVIAIVSVARGGDLDHARAAVLKAADCRGSF
jgi:hypothetical protein